MSELPAPFAPAVPLPYADLVAPAREPGLPATSDDRAARASAERLAERLGDRLARLQRLSAALVAAATAADVARALGEHAARALDARTGAVALVRAAPAADRDGTAALEVFPRVGAVPDGAPAWPAADATEALVPLAVCAHTGRPVLVADEREAADAFAAPVSAAMRESGLRALACYPLVLGGRALGVLALGWASPRVLDDDERALCEALAAQGALALERARLAGDEQHARTQLDALVDAAPTGLAFFDRELRYVRINAALVHMNRDIPAMEHLGRRPSEVHPDLAAIEPLLRRVLDGGRTLRGQEIDALETLGRAFRASFFPVPGPDGEAMGVGAISEDVTTARVAALDREFLLDLSAELQLAADSDAVATAALSRLGGRLALGRCALYEVEPAARGAVLRCAWGSPELPGGAQAAPLPAGGFAALFEEALAGRVSVHADARTPADAGAAAEGALPADVRTLCVVPLLRQGRLAAALVATDRRARRWSSRERGLLRAVAERVWPVFETARLLEAEQRARLLAESANAAKSRFLATMSHELRTPLNAIAGYAELIAMGIHGPVTEAQQDALGRLRRSQRHLLALIDDVLQYAHLEAGRVSYRREPVSMCAAVADAARLVEPVALTRGITLDASALDGVSEEALTVVADAERVRQVVRNLLSNAVKFTAPGGRVMVSLSDGARGTVTLRVADTGVGIPSDRLADVFEPFVQVDAELTRTREGTGLGLAISRDLARGMGGELAVGSEVGRGSVFTLTLPAARAE